MQGRRAGTPGNVKGTDWIAAEARRIGLEPAGEDGGWFQTVPILRRELDSAAALTVEGQTFKAWTDMIPRDQGTGARPVDGARAIYAGTWGGTLITPEQAAGKLVVVTFPPKDGVPAGSVNRAQTTQRFSTAAGIVVATLDGVGPSDRIDLEDAGAQLARGSSSGSHAAPETPTFLYGSTRFAEALMGAPAGRHAARNRGSDGIGYGPLRGHTDRVSGAQRGGDPPGQRFHAPRPDGRDRRPQRSRRDLPGGAGPRFAPRLQSRDAPRRRQQHPGQAHRRAGRARSGRSSTACGRSASRGATRC